MLYFYDGKNEKHCQTHPSGKLLMPQCVMGAIAIKKET